MFYKYALFNQIITFKLTDVCWISAWETLGVPDKRRSYDSVDPEFDDSIPDKDEGKEDFFGTFTEVFERNAR